MRFPLLLLSVSILVACSPERHAVDIPFSARLDGLELTCDSAVGQIELTDLRFYVHNFRWLSADGRDIPLELIPDGSWQNASVALLDFENGEGACINGSPQMNAVVHLRAIAVQATGLAFDVGVPDALNHADPLTAEPPLNYTDMHWHWASGYKFFRGGVQLPNDGFWLHLGSSRCAGTIGNIQGCDAKNRPTVRLEGFEPGKHIVTFDIASLLADVILNDGTPTDCSSGPTETSCNAAFIALGIDFASGDTTSTARPFGIELVQ